MTLIDHPSPNFDDRPRDTAIDFLILHYTGMKTARAALDRLCDPVSKVSAHYLIDESGQIFRLVDEKARAWHAGVSYWRGHRNLNGRSIGIELVNPGHEWGYRAFPAVQMDALIDLIQAIRTRHAMPDWHILGHSDIAPARKQDPGELFDWPLLAQQGIGVWPDPTAHVAPVDLESAPMALHNYGYDITDLAAAVRAFQRHFRPSRLSDSLDDECRHVLAALLTQTSRMPN